ncbi:reverse transcriptase domain-containing protein [Tanacetum coccineum]
MPTTGRGMSSAEIEQIVAQRVTNAIEVIAIYETKIHMAHDSIVQVVHQGTKVVKAHTAGLDHKKGYVGKLPLYNKCKLHHTGPCTVKCNNCNRAGHMTRDCRTPILATTQRPLVANQKTAVTCYKCEKQGHYRSECSKLKNRNYDNQKGNEGKTHGDPNVVADNANV